MARTSSDHPHDDVGAAAGAGAPRLRAASASAGRRQPRPSGQDQPLVTPLHGNVPCRWSVSVRSRRRSATPGRRVRRSVSAADAAAELPQLERRGGVERPLDAGDVVAGGDVLLALPQRQDRHVVGDDVLDLRDARRRRRCGRPRGGTRGSAWCGSWCWRTASSRKLSLSRNGREVVVGVGEVGEPAHAVDGVVALLLRSGGTSASRRP